MTPDAIVIIVIASLGAWTVTRIFRGPIGEAIARRIGGGPQPDGAGGEQQLIDLQARVAELEERLEFTERVLLQERQAGQLSEGEV